MFPVLSIAAIVLLLAGCSSSQLGGGTVGVKKGHGGSSQSSGETGGDAGDAGDPCDKDPEKLGCGDGDGEFKAPSPPTLITGTSAISGAGTLVGRLPLPARPKNLVAKSGIAYVLQGDHVDVVDYTDPAAPKQLDAITGMGTHLVDLVASGDNLFVLDGEAGATAFDLKSPTKAARSGLDADPTFTNLKTPGGTSLMVLSSTWLYMTTANSLLGYDFVQSIFSSSMFLDWTLGTPVVVSNRLYAPGGAKGLFNGQLNGNLGQVLATTGGDLDTPGDARGVAADGSRAYVADGPGGLLALDATNPASPHIVQTIDLGQAVDDVGVFGEYLYVRLADGALKRLPKADRLDAAKAEPTGFFPLRGAVDGPNGVYVNADADGKVVLEIYKP